MFLWSITVPLAWILLSIIVLIPKQANTVGNSVDGGKNVYNGGRCMRLAMTTSTTMAVKKTFLNRIVKSLKEVRMHICTNTYTNFREHILCEFHHVSSSCHFILVHSFSDILLGHNMWENYGPSRILKNQNMA